MERSIAPNLVDTKIGVRTVRESNRSGGAGNFLDRDDMGQVTHVVTAEFFFHGGDCAGHGRTVAEARTGGDPHVDLGGVAVVGDEQPLDVGWRDLVGGQQVVAGGRQGSGAGDGDQIAEGGDEARRLGQLFAQCLGFGPIARGPAGLIQFRAQPVDFLFRTLAGRLERLYRTASIITFGGGTNEIQRDIISIFGLGMPRPMRA